MHAYAPAPELKAALPDRPAAALCRNRGRLATGGDGPGETRQVLISAHTLWRAA